MADIHMSILEKYNINIDEVNILKLYKIDKADISPDELEKKIADCRKKWTQSINGANERFAERDRAHLEKADTYEAILKNKKLREELFKYYNKSSDSQELTSFAREYFSVVSTTKKIKKQDVDFFFDYYQEERKNKKAILEMLSKDFKVLGLGSEKSYANEDEEVDKEGKKKKSGSLVVNLFQKTTLLKIKKCDGFYQKAKDSRTLCLKYPDLHISLYEFLQLEKVDSVEAFAIMVSKKREEVFEQRQEKGQEYAPLVDLFNTLTDVLEYKDVIDNFPEFKLLIQYTKLTPYMYAFEEMKEATLKKIFEIASREYSFRDLNDFILNYFKLIYDNFNIHEQAIKGILKKAEKKANSNKILNEIDKKFNVNKSGKIPIFAKLVHWLVYWPILVLYLVFEVFKLVFTNIKRLAIPIFVVLFIASNIFFPEMLEIDNLLVFRKIISRQEWYAFVEGFSKYEIMNGFTAFLLSLYSILLMLLIYILPSFFVANFISEFGSTMSDLVDWIGFQRTFEKIFQELKMKTEEQYRKQKKLYYKRKFMPMICNLLCTMIVCGIVYCVPMVMSLISEKTGYGQEINYEQIVADEPELKETELQSILQPFVITVASANIRAGAGTENDIVATAEQGDVFWGTGNEMLSSSGSIWYEIYLNEEKTKLGWASEKVIAKQ